MLIVAATLALAPTPAAAREVFGVHGDRLGAPYPPAFEDWGDPVLLTGGVAYLDLPGKHAHAMFRPAGGPSRTLGQFEPLLTRTRKRDLIANLELAGDGRRLALGRWDEHPDGFPEGFGAVVAATLDGPARTLADCPKGVFWGPQIDGRVLAFLNFVRPGCKGDLRELAYDLATGAVFDIPSVEDNGSDPLIAGRYAIWSDQVFEHGQDIPRSLVYDFRSQRRVHVTRRWDLLAIDGDATLVAAVFTVPGKPIDYECRDLVTYTLAHTAARKLPYQTCKPYRTLLQGHRIVFMSAPPGRSPSGQRQRLMLGDTSGGPAIPLTESIGGGLTPFDFDGERIAYELHSCTVARLLAVDDVATARARGPIHIRPCRATLDPPSNAVDLERGFDLGIDCPRGCSGKLWVKSGSRRWRLRGPHLSPLAPGMHTVHVNAPSAKAASGNETQTATLQFAVLQQDGSTRTYKKPIEIERPG